MPRALRLDICTLLVAGVALAGCASSATRNRAVTLPADIATVNEGFKIDNALATQGEVLFRRRGCFICHAVGRPEAGPDLFGVVERRPIDWLQKFIIHPTEMVQTDDVAKALFEQYRFMKMPDPGVSEDEVMAIIHFLAAESQRMREAGHGAE